MATAHNYSLPVPKAYYLLEDEDGLGAGFVMERIDGETISRKILRDTATLSAHCRQSTSASLGFSARTWWAREPARVELAMQR
ncbi:MAG TPA: hypothetical protein EYQ81_08375 [Sneathiellales bacterium]|nr:hypothetical protein [Sneathiellales bacterium]